MEVVMFCLYDPKGEGQLNFIRRHRKTVIRDWMMREENNYKSFRTWHRHGWRIQKIKVTIEPKSISILENE